MKNKAIAKSLEKGTLIQTAVFSPPKAGRKRTAFSERCSDTIFLERLCGRYELGRNPVGSQAVEEDPR
jgi:hypothetical protein